MDFSIYKTVSIRLVFDFVDQMLTQNIDKSKHECFECLIFFKDFQLLKVTTTEWEQLKYVVSEVNVPRNANINK